MEHLDNTAVSRSDVVTITTTLHYKELCRKITVHIIRMGSFLMERFFWSIPNGNLTAHAEWLPGVQLKHSVPPVQYLYCEGWWLSCLRCCGSVAEYWQLKPEVSWVQLPATASFFTFLCFHFLTSKFFYLRNSFLQCA